MTSESYYKVLAEVTAAKRHTDLFAPVTGDADARLRQLKKAYRTMVIHVHPDRVDPWDRDVATDAFNRLTDLYNQATEAATDDAGDTMRHAGTFTTGVAQHTLGVQVDEWADMATCYRGTSTVSGRALNSFVKITRVPIDNDLVGTEASVLTELFDGGDPKRTVYFPKLIDTFGVEIDGKRLRANAFEHLEGFVNLEEVYRSRPGGLDPLDAAWMWRRLLWALDYAHGKGIVHGAVLPQNVMILPARHGLVLVDWVYSARKRGATYPALKAIVGARRDWYPKEVLNKTGVTPATDVAMAARTFIYLMGGDPKDGSLPGAVPAEMRLYFTQLAAKGSVDVASAAIRFEDLLKELGRPYYPRAFRPFIL